MILILMFVVNVSYMVELGEIKMAKMILSATIDVQDMEKLEALSKSLGFSKSHLIRLSLRYMFKVGVFRILKELEDHE